MVCVATDRDTIICQLVECLNEQGTYEGFPGPYVARINPREFAQLLEINTNLAALE